MLLLVWGTVINIGCLNLEEGVFIRGFPQRNLSFQNSKRNSSYKTKTWRQESRQKKSSLDHEILQNNKKQLKLENKKMKDLKHMKRRTTNSVCKNKGKRNIQKI